MDDFFIKWVKSPDRQTSIFWEDWLEKYPEKRILVEEARQLVWALSKPGQQLSEKDKKQLWENINQRRNAPKAIVNTAIVKTQKVSSARRLAVQWLYTGKIAASVMAILMIAACLIWINFNKTQPTVQLTTQYSEIKNITLPDGSQVTLNGNSTLHFFSEWTDQEDREVQLTGEAFFKVAKKPGKKKCQVYCSYTRFGY